MAPDLAVEVVSLVWVVDPETRSVVVHRPGHARETLSGEDTLNGVPVLSDFTVRVRELFT